MNQWDPVLDPARRDSIAARAPGRPDTIGHSSIQAWSAGELFPAVIARVEVYRPRAYHEAACDGALDSLAARRQSVHWELTLDGRSARFPSYDAAAAWARYVLADVYRRQCWAADPSAYDCATDHYGVI